LEINDEGKINYKSDHVDKVLMTCKLLPDMMKSVLFMNNRVYKRLSDIKKAT